MAESKGSLLAKSVQKHAGRAKEKLLQNLGKVDRTADEIFDDYLTNFNRQQNNANRLQKEFNNYIRCIRAVQTASKSLMEAICEVYETQWSGADALHAQLSTTDVLWQDFSHKLGDQVLIPLNTYTAQFPEMKKKIEKRNRKLIDYDGQRHSYQGLQANATKRKDDLKLTKGREQLEEARRTFEILNTELHDELPALHDSRILFLVTNLQTLFASEQVFHNETSKVYAELEAIVDKLATDSQRGSYTFKKLTGDSNQTSPPQSPTRTPVNSNTIVNNYPNVFTNGSSIANSPSTPPSSPSFQVSTPVTPTTPASPSPPTPHEKLTNDSSNPKIVENDNNENAAKSNSNSGDSGSSQKENAPSTTTTATTTTVISTDARNEDKYPNLNILSNSSTDTTEKNESINSMKASTNDKKEIDNNSNNINSKIVPKPEPEQINGNTVDNKNINNNNNNSNNNENINKINHKYSSTIEDYVTTTTAAATGGATPTDLPPGVLYRVKATYKYVQEDPDELSFEVGDIISVIEYDDPDDQEEGWLMGEKDGTTEKGLFPANFTRPL